MKKLIALFCVVLLAAPAFCQNILTVHQKDGNLFRYSFEEKPVVSFTDKDIVLKSTKIEVRFDMTKVSKFTFNENATSADAVKADDAGTDIVLDEYTVSFVGAKADMDVRVLSSDGKVLKTFRTGQDGSIEFSITDFTEGTYLISSESVNVKILKK